MHPPEAQQALGDQIPRRKEPLRRLRSRAHEHDPLCALNRKLHALAPLLHLGL